jgi:hypothetical protein
MNPTAIRPYDDTLDVMGHVAYDGNYGAWNTIRLKKEVLQEFPQLKEKLAKIRYKLLFYKNHQEFIIAAKKMQENNEPLPILLFFYKE